MTVINGLGAAGPRGVARRGSGGAGRFAVPGDVAGARGEVADADHASGAAPAEGLAAMLALQETALTAVDDRARRRDHAACRRGQDMLGALADLQRAMLHGQGLGAPRASMQALLDGLPVASDPQLAGIVRAIALRASVELARAGG